MKEEQDLWQQRPYQENKHRSADQRSPYQRDKARVLHSAAFRRLQSKTQVLGVGMNDFYRTRLTHSIEAAQIGTGLNAQLRQKYPQLASVLDDHLIEALCLAHDIGHPPFGHGGEVALNYMMREHGGFEGNGQTFRILTRLEPYTQTAGMNLSRRTLLGVLKYPVCHRQVAEATPPAPVASYRQLKAQDWVPAKAIYDDDKEALEWVLTPLAAEARQAFQASEPGEPHRRPLHCSLDCSIMELADDIAYSVHDLEDAIVLGIVHRDTWQAEVVSPLTQQESPFTPAQLSQLSDDLFCRHHYRRKDAIGTLVNALITSVELTDNLEHPDPLFGFRARLAPRHQGLLQVLKQFVFRNVIRKPEVQLLEYKGQQVVMELFEAFSSDPERLLPLDTQSRWQQQVHQGQHGSRVIADFISGMTDDFAARLHNNLFGMTKGNLFELQSRL
ncbi:anti-phage deoxyguanosine triphosphatase [Ferrimonas marina]|uniref:Deoxyguanosinetriphosphate triphosphohydrolase-like protein n=1 Tax=Ferrimonas marina TaxID=299255 RepID=A0A1M5Z3B2_9GAMM|nr:anti-phage deoxyguanosine triphosphatase [Ferrimonas marina]SHI18735.1 dGTPase [Ferrimonas marina]